MSVGGERRRPAGFMTRASAVGLIVAILVTACSQATPTPVPTASPTPTTDTRAADDPFAQEYWDHMNTMLVAVYGLPPVPDVQFINTAGYAVSNFLGEGAAVAAERLESSGIPWARTAPFCYLFAWYIEADTAINQITTPLEFITAESRLAERGRWLLEAADSMILTQLLEEPLSTHPTEAACLEGFTG